MMKRAFWPTVKLEEVCEHVTVGHVGPMVEEYLESGVPFLRSQNVRPFRFDPTENEQIQDRELPIHSHARPHQKSAVSTYAYTEDQLVEQRVIGSLVEQLGQTKTFDINGSVDARRLAESKLTSFRIGEKTDAGATGLQQSRARFRSGWHLPALVAEFG